MFSVQDPTCNKRDPQSCRPIIDSTHIRLNHEEPNQATIRLELNRFKGFSKILIKIPLIKIKYKNIIRENFIINFLMNYQKNNL